MKTGLSPTGSGRRQSYRVSSSISRMRNTFIEAGQSRFDGLMSHRWTMVLYAKSMGGGSVGPGAGDFNFAIEEA